MKPFGGLELDTASLNPESCTPKVRALDACRIGGKERADNQHAGYGGWFRASQLDVLVRGKKKAHCHGR